MPTDKNQPIDLKRAYEILGVADSASTISVKLAYRRLARRWHPDFYPNGSTTREEAAYMMRIINEAYSAISHPPLRNLTAHEQYAPGKPDQAESMGGPELESAWLFGTRGVEFWVRFLAGAAISAVIGVSIVMECWELGMSGSAALFLVGVATLIFASGYTAARYGDSFWARALDRWWFW